VFEKALEKIIDLLTEAVRAKRFGWLLLIYLAVVGGSLVAIVELQSSPQIIEAFHNAVFLTICVFASAIALSYLAWHVPNVKRIWRVLIVSASSIGSIGIWWGYIKPDPSIFKIDVVVAPGNSMDPAQLANFLEDVKQKHIKVTVIYRELVPGMPPGVLNYDEAKKKALPHQRSSDEANGTVLVTNHQLSDYDPGDHGILYYKVSSRFAVVSRSGTQGLR